MVAVEGAATIPGVEDGQAETERPEPVLPGAGPKPKTTRARGSWRDREGNHQRNIFSIIRATGQAATKDLYVSDDLLCSASARRSADVRWSASRSGSGTGKRRDLIPTY